MTPTSIEVLASAQTAASGLYGLHDVLSSVGIVWETLVSGQPADAQFDVRIVAEQDAPFRCITGGMIAPDSVLNDAGAPDILIVPGISASPSGRFTLSSTRLRDWLILRKRQGTQITSACTGALVLAEAGLLEGLDATTHWAYGDVFRRHYPGVRLRADRSLCVARDGTVTSGGTTAWQQLATYLIAENCGREHALRATKFWLLPDSGSLQGPYAAMPLGREHDDGPIRLSQAWVDEHFATPHPVEVMIATSALPPTTFARRFRRATGYAPMEYVHAVRVEAAKQMLESSGRPIEQIGGSVGYEDTASFRRLFKRQTGLTPREYRQTFGQARFERLVEN